MKVTVMGAGAWGTTLAILLSQSNNEVFLWSHEKDVISGLKTYRENKKYLNGFPISANITATNDFSVALPLSEVLIYCIPTQFLKKIVKDSINYFKGNYIVSATKGIEIETLKLPSEIIEEFTGKDLFALSGPNLAREIASGLPAVSVLAGNTNKQVEIQSLFKNCKNFRVYTSNDMIGVQIGGALKNVIAIAAGAIEGKNLGHNAKAALIIRGMAEIIRLGTAMGAKSSTFSGLSGLGDLITTCLGNSSRNHYVGFLLAQGKKIDSIVSSMDHVAEGVTTTKATIRLRDKYKIEMPITSEIYDVLFKDKNIDEALANLMTRPLKSEEQ